MRRAASAFYLAAFALLGSVEAHGHAVRPSDHSKRNVCAIDPKAIVSDACASFDTLDNLNLAIQSSIDSLTKQTDFFSYYRLNLYDKECPFWNDESGMCGNIACAVNTIDEEKDIPAIWRAEELSKLQGPKAQHPNRQMQRERNERPLQGELGEDVDESCVVEYDDECDERDYCVPEDESATAKGDYVSLVDNPEKFTGYSGPSAHQVWEAIYRENCFATDSGVGDTGSSQSSSPLGVPRPVAGANSLRSMMREQEKSQILAAATASPALDDVLQLNDECLEKRTFYRIISGMHASISSHLCWDYLNQTTGEWGPNVQCYEDRLHNHPDRISNLYFNYALVLRAVAKARKMLEGYTFCSGDASQDRMTKKKVLALADQIARGPQIYDESLMFQDPTLKEDFRNRFRNVSRTMDCVGCDKCRLWGKIQTAGYGTALKILFEFDESSSNRDQLLRRTEVVALMNTLDKISHAISAVSNFHTMLDERDRHQHETQAASPITKTEQKKPKNREVPRRRMPRHDDGILDDLFLEIDLIWRTCKWVVEGWMETPKTIFQIGLGNFAWLYAKWLGLEAPTGNTWEWKQPPAYEYQRDEL